MEEPDLTQQRGMAINFRLNATVEKIAYDRENAHGKRSRVAASDAAGLQLEYFELND